MFARTFRLEVDNSFWLAQNKLVLSVQVLSVRVLWRQSSSILFPLLTFWKVFGHEWEHVSVWLQYNDCIQEI